MTFCEKFLTLPFANERFMSAVALHIDVREVLRNKAPKYSRWIPGFAVRWLARIIHQDELNEILRRIGDKTGVEAARVALDYLGVKIEVRGLEQVPVDGRYIYVSNHPLGGLDGMALIQLLGDRHQGNIRFLVNDLLMAVKPLAGIFLPVNKYGRQSREAAVEIERQYAGPNQMITFPAGLCSRKMDDGTIADLTWSKFIVTHAVAHRRHLVPVYVDAKNSALFYRMARWRVRLGIKFNVEMILLPREMFKLRGTTLRVSVGEPIACDTLDAAYPREETERVRHAVYQLANT